MDRSSWQMGRKGKKVPLLLTKGEEGSFVALVVKESVEKGKGEKRICGLKVGEKGTPSSCGRQGKHRHRKKKKSGGLRLKKKDEEGRTFLSLGERKEASTSERQESSPGEWLPPSWYWTPRGVPPLQF